MNLLPAHRILAQRCAQAAKETATKIEDSIQKSAERTASAAAELSRVGGAFGPGFPLSSILSRSFRAGRGRCNAGL